MKKSLLLVLILIAISSFATAKSFYDPLYRKSADVSRFIGKNLQKLYDADKGKRETVFKQLKAAASKPKRKGDSHFSLGILGDFVLGNRAPGNMKTNSGVNSHQETVLEYLVETAKNDEVPISDREFVIGQLGKIAKDEGLFDFDQNETAVGALRSLAGDDDNLVLQHSAMVALKRIVLKKKDRWDDLAEDAAGSIVDELGSGNAELQRIAFIECLDILAKAKKATDGTKLVWEKTAATISDIKSPKLQYSISLKLKNLIKSKSSSAFKEQINELKEALKELKSTGKTIVKPVSEMLSELKDEDDPAVLEALIDSLVKQAKKDRTVLNAVYSKIEEFAFFQEISDYKLRILNKGLITLTHISESPLFYYRTSMVLLGEISVFHSTQRANIPIVMLGNLMASTDYEGLVSPVMMEIKLSVYSDLPIWIGKRLIGLIFIQAGDSPNGKIAITAAKQMAKITQDAKKGILKWEARKRLKYLSIHASDDVVKDFAANWR